MPGNSLHGPLPLAFVPGVLHGNAALTGPPIFPVSSHSQFLPHSMGQNYNDYMLRFASHSLQADRNSSAPMPRIVIPQHAQVPPTHSSGFTAPYQNFQHNQAPTASESMESSTLHQVPAVLTCADSSSTAPLSKVKRTTFKPQHTKRTRPKINKILSEGHDSRQKIPIPDLAEESMDDVFADFASAFNINRPRLDITKACDLLLLGPFEKQLFDLYVQKIAVFIDVFLPRGGRFQLIVAELALYDDTRTILDSIFCLSSLILQRMKPESMDSLSPLKFYQRLLSLIQTNLYRSENESFDSGLLARCLISTNLLCIFELFFVASDSTYVKGAGSILMSILSRKSVSGLLLKSSDFFRSCFLAMYVCDLVLSLKLEAPSMYSLEKVWQPLDPEFFGMFDNYPDSRPAPNSPQDLPQDLSFYLFTKESISWWQHKILFLLGLINAFAHLHEVITFRDFESGKRFVEWQNLKRKLEEFERYLPLHLKPLFLEPPPARLSIPLVYFKDERSAIVGINLRIANLVLLGALSRRMHVRDTLVVDKEILKYSRTYKENIAKEIAGIMKTYDSNMKIWPVNIHALRQAAKFVDSELGAYDELKQLTVKVVRVCFTRLHIDTLV